MKKMVFMQTIKEDGTRLKPVIRNTEKGRSDYANRMYKKYGEGVTVEEYIITDDMEIKILSKWHA